MKKSIKVIALLLALSLVFAFAACGGNGDNNPTDAANPSPAPEFTPVALSDIKVGLICLHDENSTYDNNFIMALEDVQKTLGLSDEQVLIKTNIGETDACLNAASELVEAGCNVIFADSFGHETYIKQAAQEFPKVQFCHATGVSGKSAGIANFHTAFADIYEGRYLAGVAAGLKLNEMIDAGKITADKAVIGYVGAFDYAEVVSGMTSFFLGARSVCETATMKVTYTNSWFDIALEREAALKLIDSGCVLISQHADSEGAPKACEEKNVPNIAYNIDTASIGPNTAIVSSRINWAPYYTYAINSVVEGKAFSNDWCGGIAEGSVELLPLNEAVAAEGTAAKLAEIKAKFEEGTLKVYDCSTFTVDGKNLTEYLADVDGDFTGETNVIVTEDGVTYFSESGEQFRSAPYFDIKYIDGVSAL